MTDQEFYDLKRTCRKCGNLDAMMCSRCGMANMARQPEYRKAAWAQKVLDEYRGQAVALRELLNPKLFQ